MLRVKKDVSGYGTYMASKVYGFVDSPAKKATIIPVIFDMTIESLLAVLQTLILNIKSRRRRDETTRQALSGKISLLIP